MWGEVVGTKYAGHQHAAGSCRAFVDPRETLPVFRCFCSSSLLRTRVFVVVQLARVCHVSSTVVAAVEDSVAVLVFCFSVAPFQPWALLADPLVGFLWLRMWEWLDIGDDPWWVPRNRYTVWG